MLTTKVSVEKYMRLGYDVVWSPPPPPTTIVFEIASGGAAVIVKRPFAVNKMKVPHLIFLSHMGWRAKKAHNLFSHKLSLPPFVPRIVPGTNWVCPRDKPGFAGLPVCKIGRKPRFVPGSSQDQPDKKVYVYVPFSCLMGGL